MTLSLRSQSQIVVADARPHDYQELTRLAVEHGWHVHLLTSARAVLRLTGCLPIDLYLVNARLPDMSGFDLFEMLRDQVTTAQVFIVSDSYDDEDERRACRHGAALYLCKGPNRCVDFGGLLDFLLDQREPNANSPLMAPSVGSVDSLPQPCGVRSPADVPLGEPTH
jgi:PleD family two-component response regulator